ncbi:MULTISPECIES: SEL1-like repeat protein [unclassified Ensifer]|uniref:SEL1-like repeat protein n=1 Tax=unclassified Ensifer TaxID=2633371 RepID=UPI00070B1064|nr:MULTISPECIES: SEL1-like repeat protein [unclassified Ensifer]MDP9628513.1 localization factor PodJL [Ensifer adhaerens]KQU98185.1 peptidoglycan-binding protein [Ensifer sp. Root31]KQW62943.1 peptidoglycan-binding protein [Ensifer sp. Root1252]KRC83764.1 peptidoglycan-binding protein [Ensifer sp. Root231]KRD04117.1 peptidoglycan-binding protein [Ensifer sp. Root258]
MNGSRSNPQRAGSQSYGERPSLDALNRTIEGLEARIEGLMNGAGREPPARPVERERVAPRDIPSPRDAVSEIMQRQRALSTSRERPPLRDRLPQREPDRLAQREPERYVDDIRPQPVRAPVARPAAAVNDIAEALVGLRQDLKRDITEGVTREMNSLRAEIRGIKVQAQDHSFAEDVRGDMQRLADSIQQLGRQASPAQADALRSDFDDLRAMIDGLAREDSVRRMESRWNGVEDRLIAFDQNRDDELVALAYRLDEIKSQIGALGNSSAVDVLEDKMIAVAQAIEMLGRQIQPDDRRLVSQFADLDARLDEISRAIAANSRSASGLEGGFANRLETRLGDLSRQIDGLSRPVDSGLGARLEALAARVEDLAGEKAAAGLEERLDQLSMLMERSHRNVQPDLTNYLNDISRKIEALDQGSVNDALAERLDYLARRIDDLDTLSAHPVADPRFDRLEDRLAGIAQRLEETYAAPFDDRAALHNLEAQIANLSTLVSQPRSEAGAAMPVEFESRMNALEDYFATSDEYIVEAARQAAEAVMEAYSRKGMPQSAGGGDLAAISALAEDLRTLEDLSRSSDERTARTFEALHETLVHIADKLERIEGREPAMAAAHYEAPVAREIAAMPKAAQPEFNDPFSGADLDDRYQDLQRNVRALQAEDDGVIAAATASAHATAFAGDEGQVSTIEPDGARERPATARTGLLAGLTRRFSGKRAEPAQELARQLVEPAPSIDPSEMLAPEEANQLLEPGSGVPDVKKILERVRAGQMNRGGKQAADGDKADFIAAARRAAQLAVEEADTLNKTKDGGVASGVGGAFARHRRPILMAVGAVLLAIMSYPLVGAMLKGSDAPVAEPVAIIEQQLAPVAEQPAIANATKVAGDQAPAAAAVATETPVEALQPIPEAPLDSVEQPSSAVETPAAATPPADTSASTKAVNETQAPLLQPVPEAKGPVAASTFQAAPVDAAQAGTFAPVAKAAEVVLPDGFGPVALVTAAKGGDPLAFYEIGARYTEGRGVNEDLAEAAKWYQRAADAGVVPAEYRLASMYEKGSGLTRDAAKAKVLYLKAAEQGNASAMHNLAVMLASGRDGSPDFAEATKWFAKAAELGIRDSQFNLAVLYARGNGVPQDLEASYKWFSAAAREGDMDAAAKRDDVAKAMKPEQLSSAKAKADAWKPQAVDAKANTVDVPDAWVGPANKTASIDMSKAIRNIQAILNNNGFDAGKPDGQMGKKTVAAIKAFQTSVGQEPTGEITDQLVKELLKRNS